MKIAKNRPLCHDDRGNDDSDDNDHISADCSKGSTENPYEDPAEQTTSQMIIDTVSVIVQDPCGIAVTRCQQLHKGAEQKKTCDAPGKLPDDQRILLVGDIKCRQSKQKNRKDPCGNSEKPEKEIADCVAYNSSHAEIAQHQKDGNGKDCQKDDFHTDAVRRLFLRRTAASFSGSGCFFLCCGFLCCRCFSCSAGFGSGRFIFSCICHADVPPLIVPSLQCKINGNKNNTDDYTI